MSDIDNIKRAVSADSHILAELAVRMWSKHTVAELEEEFAKLICGENAACFIKYVGGRPVGFAQCGLRFDYVEGTESSPVGYLEGVYILPEFRHKGIAAELLYECEAWVKEKNCTEFASDCELDNEASLMFHLAMGFEEANRIICFKKRIG